MSRKQSPEESDKLKQVQGKVSEVKIVMQQNIEEALERGNQLSELEDKSENLKTSAEGFYKGSRDLQRHMWWKNCRTTALIISIVLIVITILSLIIYYSTKN
jgi:preprotein translocase subunit SecE